LLTAAHDVSAVHHFSNGPNTILHKPTSHHVSGDKRCTGLWRINV